MFIINKGKFSLLKIILKCIQNPGNVPQELQFCSKLKSCLIILQFLGFIYSRSIYKVCAFFHVLCYTPWDKIGIKHCCQIANNLKYRRGITFTQVVCYQLECIKYHKIEINYLLVKIIFCTTGSAYHFTP